jgi:cytochrome c-type biogenesis protein CcmH
LKRAFIATLVVAAVLLATAPALAAPPVTVRDIEGDILCQCNCTKLVKDCDCGTANTMREEIQGQIDKGLNKKKIMAYLVGKYGKPVLAAPTAQGFDLTAWVTPFIAIVVAGALLYLILRRWVRRHRVLVAEAAGAGPVGATAIDTATAGLDESERAALKDRMQRELQDYL